MAQPQMKHGTPRLSEIARKVVAPDGITSTGWPAVRDCCSQKMGVEFDPWQHAAGRLILAKRSDGKFASMIGGVGMSLPRQVGKTYLVGAMVFALCILRPGLLVIWSAHHARTHGETFLAMQAFAKRSKVAAFIAQVFTGSGDEEIRFLNGSRILFGARERGFGRGIPGVDVIVSDEAQIMSDKALDAQLATMNTSLFGLAIFIGTPPRPDDPSEAFARMRAEAWAGTLRDAAWIEFGADADADPNDRKQWAKGNPSFPTRTPAESILRLQRKLTADSFRREGLGIWDDFRKASCAFDMGRWAALEVGADEVPTSGAPAYGIKFSPDGQTVALSVAVRSGDTIHVEGVAHRQVVDGTRWLVEWIGARWGGAAGVVVDGKAGAGAFVKALGRAGVRGRRLVELTADQAVTATAGMVTAVAEGTVTHIDDDVLTGAIGASMRRPIGRAGGFGIQSMDDTSVTLAEAAVLAHYGAVTAKRSDAVQGSTRRAVMLS